MNEVIREMVVLLSYEITQHSISASTELAVNLPVVVGDRVQLQQVLMNLMINGIDAMKNVEGTRQLTLNSELSDDGQLLVSVHDTGSGLPMDSSGPALHCVLHHQESWYRNGAVNQPLDRRISRWSPVGDQQFRVGAHALSSHCRPRPPSLHDFCRHCNGLHRVHSNADRSVRLKPTWPKAKRPQTGASGVGVYQCLLILRGTQLSSFASRCRDVL